MSLRARLTLAYSAVLAGVLLVFGAALYLILSFSLIIQIDQTLARSAEEILRTSRVTTQRESAHSRVALAAICRLERLRPGVERRKRR